MNVYTKSGQRVRLKEPPLGRGGEGAVYRMRDHADKVAKLYHDPADAAARKAKIEAMASLAGGFSAGGPLEAVAWPLGTLYADAAATRFVGFGMRKLASSLSIAELYEYPPPVNFSMADKLRVAESLAQLVVDLHAARQVVGDFNDNNVVVLHGCKAGLVDADSFHVSAGGIVYPCCVCLEGYVAPSVLRNMHGFDSYESCTKPTFTPHSDDWALAVHLFRILFNGIHPYHCVPMTAGGSPPAPTSVDKRVERGETPYFRRVAGAKVSPYAPDVSMLPGYLRELFERAFVRAHAKPSACPTAAEWRAALARYRADVRQTCSNEAHWHAAGGGGCPYCAADARTAAALALPAGSTGGRAGAATPPPAPTAAAPPAAAAAQAAPQTATTYFHTSPFASPARKAAAAAANRAANAVYRPLASAASRAGGRVARAAQKAVAGVRQAARRAAFGWGNAQRLSERDHWLFTMVLALNIGIACGFATPLPDAVFEATLGFCNAPLRLAVAAGAPAATALYNHTRRTLGTTRTMATALLAACAGSLAVLGVALVLYAAVQMIAVAIAVALAILFLGAFVLWLLVR